MEVLLGAALAVAGWRVLEAARQPAPRASLVRPRPAFHPQGPAPAALPSMPSTTAAPGRAHLETGTAFLRSRLAQLNRDEAAWSRAQWRIIDALLGAIRRYLDSTVVPAVLSAESHPGGAPAAPGPKP